MFILLKGLLLELSGHGNPHDYATPKVIPDSNSCILGLSNEVSFVSGFFWTSVYIIGWLLQIAVVLIFILIFRVFCGLDGGNLMPGIKFPQILPRLGIFTHAGYLYPGWVTLPKLGNFTQPV